MIDFEFVLRIHKTLIKLYGGDVGIRDAGLLDGALKRPFQSFEGKDLYETTVEKGAALIQSLINNHPFIDGNKRVGYFILRWFLITNNMDFNVKHNHLYDFIIQIASGNYDFETIKKWLENNTVSI